MSSTPTPKEIHDEKVPGVRVGPRSDDLVCGVRAGDDVPGGEVMNANLVFVLGLAVWFVAAVALLLAYGHHINSEVQ